MLLYLLMTWFACKHQHNHKWYTSHFLYSCHNIKFHLIEIISKFGRWCQWITINIQDTVKRKLIKMAMSQLTTDYINQYSTVQHSTKVCTELACNRVLMGRGGATVPHGRQLSTSGNFSLFFTRFFNGSCLFLNLILPTSGFNSE